MLMVRKPDRLVKGVTSMFPESPICSIWRPNTKFLLQRIPIHRRVVPPQGSESGVQESSSGFVLVNDCLNFNNDSDSVIEFA